MSASRELALAIALFGLLAPLPAVHAQTAAEGSASAAVSPAGPSLSDRKAAQDAAFLRYSKDRKTKSLSPEERAALLAQLQGHPLVDYALAWDLYDVVAADPADEIATEAALEFIDNRQGEYIAERLGTDLARVAAAKGMTELFERLYAPLQWNKTEPDLAAWHEANELQAGRGDAARGIALLAASRSLRNSASAALSEALAAKSPELAWTAAKLLIQGKNFPEARKVISQFTNADPAALAALFANASAWLSGLEGDAQPSDLLACAILLSAQSGTDFASAALESHAAELTGDDLALLWGFLGAREAASSNFAQAQGFFDKIGDAPLPEAFFQPASAAETRARASLAAGDWAGVARAVRAMPENQRREPAWTYWLARALKATGKETDAAKLFESLAHRHDYYGLLACDALGRPYPGEKMPEPAPDEAVVRQWMQNASIIRAAALRRLHLYAMASREWNWALRGADQTALAAAAECARRADLPERMINTAGKLTSAFSFALSFPTPREEDAARIAQSSGVDEAWIYGVTRQESRFMPLAASGAGAQGLMQLLPSTAKWTAKRYGLGSDAPDLSDPATNMTLGAYYLKYLAERFDGQKLLATAGYNAGPGRSSTWKKRLAAPQEGAVFAELIPFRETREYVKNVLANTALYHLALGSASPETRLTALLGTVEPPPADPESAPAETEGASK